MMTDRYATASGITAQQRSVPAKMESAARLPRLCDNPTRNRPSKPSGRAWEGPSQGAPDVLFQGISEEKVWANSTVIRKPMLWTGAGWRSRSFFRCGSESGWRVRWGGPRTGRPAPGRPEDKRIAARGGGGASTSLSLQKGRRYRVWLTRPKTGSTYSSARVRYYHGPRRVNKERHTTRRPRALDLDAVACASTFTATAKAGALLGGADWPSANQHLGAMLNGPRQISTRLGVTLMGRSSSSFRFRGGGPRRGSASRTADSG